MKRLKADLHVHTALSFDAWGQGTRTRPRDAYRFAMGEPIGFPRAFSHFLLISYTIPI